MHDKNIFQPLLEDTLYISARYLAKNDIYHFLIKISHILQQQDEIDNDLTELFEDSNWRKVYSGCLTLVIASRNQQTITHSIEAAWKNISQAGQDAIPLFGSLQLVDKNFNQYLLEFINNGLPITLYTPDEGNTRLFIQRQGTMAIIIEQLLKTDSTLHNDIAEHVNFAMLNKIKQYADPYAEPIYEWKDKLITLLATIKSSDEEALLASIKEQEIDKDELLSFWDKT